jgi:hypothetical protein
VEEASLIVLVLVLVLIVIVQRGIIVFLLHIVGLAPDRDYLLGAGDVGASPASGWGLSYPQMTSSTATRWANERDEAASRSPKAEGGEQGPILEPARRRMEKYRVKL